MVREYKLVVLGMGGVGKSAITVRFVQGVFVDQYDPTIEDSYRKPQEINGVSCVLEILDTAGTENFAAMRDLYLRNGEGFLVVYAVNTPATFNDLEPFRTHIVRVKNLPNNQTVPIALIANKIDVPANEREITQEAGKALADSWKALYFETSAKENINVTKAFVELCQEISRLKGDSVNAKPKKSGGCMLL
ncbi:proPprap1 protein [Capsaspora owczarzaki ATCC 30864]|uniref:ProPprap1 protein n=1 Tax=Capsaspora owczarzaki (strain ATCC 30864) TaxID=595528 RepID=A0A0D2VWA5_CAPO3|nr:proPprap1 protein [Capsaspora owczarzaki ATCC 30864]KJE95827.1 proPprap1 protein [Capsaspora owczarzaki ATCC 30864]|eukprot:XP_004344982.1 proPprap1 protein [Capsaspora owczarzaki ATCC 30864]